MNSPENDSGPTPARSRQDPANLAVDFSPPLIAMVVVVGTAFLVVTYFRLISRHVIPPLLRLLQRFHRRRRRRQNFGVSATVSDVESPPPDTDTPFHFFSHYGLDETAIKTIPLSVYDKSKRQVNGGRDCAVCLLEFEDNDYVRTLPVCAHAFHVDCIDIWLRTHATCPLCRAGIFRQESPFVPLMAARIRPSLDDRVLESLLVETLPPESDAPVTEIAPSVVEDEASPARNESEDRFNGRDFLLKRSYSFGFERNLARDRLVLDAATASPWRYRRSSFWSKRLSPFSSSKARVFSLRYYRGMKSPFFRRRGFFPLSESSARYSGGFGGGGSSRRSKSLTSPSFLRSSAAATAFSSSRLRCGDPEALLSPDRLNRR